MSIETAITRLAALRCQGVAEARHYSFGAIIPDTIPEPALFWALGSLEEWELQGESFDARSGTLDLGVTMTLLLQPYKGRMQSHGVADFPVWIQRVMDMLVSDLLLGDSLVMPMSGEVRKVGVLSGRSLRYLGVIIDLILRVRIEAS